MKKLSLFLFVIVLFTGCEAVQSFINYFVDIESSELVGTENTEFVFKANSNDIVDQWIIDGAIISARYANYSYTADDAADNFNLMSQAFKNSPDMKSSAYIRSTANANELTYSFSSGSHTIGVLTNNGATDEVQISVSPVDIIFKMSAVQRAATTEIYLDYPILTVEGVNYNVETDTNIPFVSLSNTETDNIISISMEVDFEDFFYFMNDNALNLENIDINNMSIADMNKMIMILFPERYIEPEPPYDLVIYNVSGVQRAQSQSVGIYSEYITIAGQTIENKDISTVYMDGNKNYMIGLEVDFSDFFLFMSGNTLNFFGFDQSDMTYDEAVIFADILNRYPAEGILELKAVYNP